MNWTRKEVKEKAKAALKRNYWKAVFISFIFILLGGGTGSTSASSVVNKESGKKANEIIAVREDEVTDYVDSVRESMEKAENGFDAKDAVIVAVFAVTAVVIFAVVFLIAIVVDVFLVNPLWVGAQRFMLKSVDDRGAISELGYTFDHNYMNGVKTTFMRDLSVFLWTLLFIIPGIYKKYQYYMVDFILAENPDMPYEEVLRRSRDMMEGQKWNAFVLDLSFILWHMLSFITCGISEIAYVKPYINLTRAALYRELSGRGDTAYIAVEPEEAPGR